MRQVLVLAIVFMLLWVVAVPLLYLVLLLRCRGAILAHQPTGLSRAVRFLWKEYKDGYYLWELFEVLKKLALTNVLLAADVEHGSSRFLRLVIALMVCFVALTLHLLALPFRKADDNLRPSRGLEGRAA